MNGLTNMLSLWDHQLVTAQGFIKDSATQKNMNKHKVWNSLLLICINETQQERCLAPPVASNYSVDVSISDVITK